MHQNEITKRVIILSILLTIVLAISNTYLALKIGMLTSASIPAAIISMGILRFFKNATIFENNLVQTAASSGEAIAGGIVFSIPALILIHYWHGFPFWENFLISVCGGTLGVVMSVPLRRMMVHDKQLAFPEAKAVAEVLRAGHEQQIGLKELFWGAGIGAVVELLQTAFKVIAGSVQAWFSAGRTILGFGAGFSAALVGAGYLMGIEIAGSLFLGVIFAWVTVVILGELNFSATVSADPAALAASLYGAKIRFIGIGAMLTSGIWLLITSFKPIMQSLLMLLNYHPQQFRRDKNSIKEYDMPGLYLFALTVLLMLALLLGYHSILPLQVFGFSEIKEILFLFSTVIFTLFAAFIFSAIAAYFSGLVGVGPSPGSAILIATFFLTTIFMMLWGHFYQSAFIQATTIIIATVAFGAAAIANDNMQDLKVGYLIGATPWKQQAMLILGVVVASMVSPIVMQLLFNVYGIGDVLPHAGMDPQNALTVPPAAAIAALTQAIFQGQLPWEMMLIGAALGVALIIARHTFLPRVSVLATAIGVYLPLSTSMPLVFGGVIAFFVERYLKHRQHAPEDASKDFTRGRQKAVLAACGLVTGAAIADVLVALPFAIFHNPDLFKINLPYWGYPAEILGFASVLLIGGWIYWLVISEK